MRVWEGKGRERRCAKRSDGSGRLSFPMTGRPAGSRRIQQDHRLHRVAFCMDRPVKGAQPEQQACARDYSAFDGRTRARFILGPRRFGARLQENPSLRNRRTMMTLMLSAVASTSMSCCQQRNNCRHRDCTNGRRAGGGAGRAGNQHCADCDRQPKRWREGEVDVEPVF